MPSLVLLISSYLVEQLTNDSNLNCLVFIMLPLSLSRLKSWEKTTSLKNAKQGTDNLLDDTS
jgi:hypothetical protein